MKFKADENLPIEVVLDLRTTGSDVHSVHDERLTGAADSELLTIAQREGRVFLTLDKGSRTFGCIPRTAMPVSSCFDRQLLDVEPY